MKERRWLKSGVIIGIITVFIRSIASPEWLEQYYSRGVFPGFRVLLDTFVTSWFPIPLVYLFIPFLLFSVGKGLFKWSRSQSRGKGLRAIAGLLNFTGWTIGLFLLMWGFNYGRQPVEERIGIQPKGLALSSLQTIIRQEAGVLANLRAKIPQSDTLALHSEHFPKNMEEQLRQALEEVLDYYNYPTVGNVRGRIIEPKGILLRISTAGIYFPWTGEGHIDAGLIHLQRPYTMTHELAHGYGFGDEGSCSFWAYLAAFKVTDPALEYAIRLGYWRSLAVHWVRADSVSYHRFRAQLPKGIIADLTAINENIAAYPDIFPNARNAAYDTYLKAQGIAEGLQNYGRVINLVEAWRVTEGEDIFE